MRAVPRMRTAVALVAAAASLTLGLTSAATAAQFVGLGDSYAAGPLIPGNTAAPFHPNQRGMAGVTPTVVAAATAP